MHAAKGWIQPWELFNRHHNFVSLDKLDYIMAHGCCSVSKESCEYILNSGPGSSIAIVVGGAQESLAAKPGTLDLTLKKRLGFIKLALVNGADLVPTLAFGENDLYELYGSTRVSRTYQVQQFLKKVLGFTVPIFNGRGVFNCKLSVFLRFSLSNNKIVTSV